MSQLRNLLTNKIMKANDYSKAERKLCHADLRPAQPEVDKRPPYWQARLGPLGGEFESASPA